jgi:hypothetical protein
MAIWTEWDKLTDVIIGDCHEPGSFDHLIDSESVSGFNLILEETKEDLLKLEEKLKSYDCNVTRPTLLTPKETHLSGFDIQLPNSPLVPRDQYIVIDKTIYQTYTSLTDRYFDGLSFYKIFQDLFDNGYNWIAQPSPNLVNLDPTTKWWIDGKDVYHDLLKEKILWHTATMFKAGDKLITNIQGPGTNKGLEWCHRNIKDVDIIANDSTCMEGWGHIDHGFFFVNDETIVCDNKSWVPSYLQDKKIIEIGSYLKDSYSIIENYAKDFKSTQGIYSKEWLETYLDKWRGYDQEIHFDTNVLVLDHNLILFSREIPELFRMLKTYGIECESVPMRHGTYWESGIHCLTLDVAREGSRRQIF